MKNKQILLSVLTAGLALGTAWAVRGKFGHEQGAAWAGAIGALSVILLAGRKDWYKRAFNIALAAAFGWGISGVMSYGIIVGYGRGTDFLNVFYGLLMLFVLGVLYGFLGGGFFGLTLMDSRANGIKWHSLLGEMVALGLLTYAVLINQLEWFMTPPRSEMWAACLGASIALAWYMARNRHHNAMKVAVWSALGAGFGFAFGNFLQVMGNSTGIDFNFWNVMEYSIGFFGGVGMAYGTFTSSWSASDEVPSRFSNLISILFVALFVPFVVWEQSFITDRFNFILESGGSASLIFYFKLMAIVAILVVAILALIRNDASSRTIIDNPYGRVKEFFILYTALYIFLSFLVTGILVHPPEQYFYIVNLLLILLLSSRINPGFEVREDKPATWLTIAAISVTVIAVLTAIAINSHEGMQGSHLRFGNP
ncbi:MAG TPA: hypothetical protein VFO54_04925 [Chryseosolibacter sp.]|nr:hypothetical protein [Chryseosolibacter sp.]